MQIFLILLINLTMTFKIAALYKFTPIADIESLRAEIYAFGESVEGLCGTLLLAPEGVNGTIAAHEDALPRMIAFLDEKLGVREGSKACELKYSTAEQQPFNRFKVRPKKELITLRKSEADPSQQVGEYVAPQDWNDLINDPDVLLIDTRNDYETKVGIFEGAVDPDMKVFTEFPDWVEKHLNPEQHKKVAMFCTGGIRCEKASSYMLSQGFENVYHLKGGILQYLEEVPKEQSKWDGECFVFDQRVSVKHGLEEGSWSVCHACREPLSEADTQRAEYENGVSCHHCVGTLTPEREQALRQRKDHYAQRYGEAS